ncbi:hypothetical protein EMIHUDRAFT_223171 [Emiliania huxleyi CCMP1516]|uniref:AB hydrolase-1 domain-containing protein n=2 Tax=Emiliania huxleyi TaxID=2903 RepID=A0A0D3KW30_EMIH1|nr:hypothetical protein EMIHUDRAFT_223171 [Emiliania huxleyi CCMP1516]EOD39965.1 hypothetical protein EMIHUDRAFT_223171 [Emiliania huxleyi CCMP1516]|eukprot:XP_005792394.1 hypothetical protein EMIHUDRAFT_223171 [Emiliania huxleyi CCMP1516]
MVPALAKALALAHGSRTPASFVRQRFPCRPADGVPVILMLPGINNDAAFPYVQHVMRLVLAEGLGTPAAVNWRGLGGLPLSAAGGATPKVYCGLGAPDLAEILSHLRRRLPSSPLYAVGWSMGGCILVRHMAEAGEGCELRAAMAVSPALDVSAVQRYWQGAHSGSGGTPVGRLYGLAIGFKLWLYFLSHRRELAGGPVWRAFLGVFRGYEDEVFAPLWGLSGHEEPLLVVHARDDPVVPVWSLPLAAMASNPHIVTAITRHGGHIGYTAGATPLLGAWTDRVLVHYLRAILAREEEREGREQGEMRGSGCRRLPTLCEHSKL